MRHRRRASPNAARSAFARFRWRRGRSSTRPPHAMRRRRGSYLWFFRHGETVTSLSRAHFAHDRRPFKNDVVDRRLEIGEQVPQASVLAALERLDENAPGGEAAYAHAPDQIVAGRIAHVVVKHQPIVEKGAERMPADLHRHRM